MQEEKYDKHYDIIKSGCNDDICLLVKKSYKGYSFQEPDLIETNPQSIWNLSILRSGKRKEDGVYLLHCVLMCRVYKKGRTMLYELHFFIGMMIL